MQQIKSDTEISFSDAFVNKQLNFIFGFCANSMEKNVMHKRKKNSKIIESRNLWREKQLRKKGIIYLRFMQQ